MSAGQQLPRFMGRVSIGTAGAVADHSPARIEISPAAYVHPNAWLGDGVTVGPFCMVGPNVQIGPGSHLMGSNVVVGASRADWLVRIARPDRESTLQSPTRTVHAGTEAIHAHPRTPPLLSWAVAITTNRPCAPGRKHGAGGEKRSLAGAREPSSRKHVARASAANAAGGLQPISVQDQCCCFGKPRGRRARIRP